MLLSVSAHVDEALSSEAPGDAGIEQIKLLSGDGGFILNAAVLLRGARRAL